MKKRIRKILGGTLIVLGSILALYVIFFVVYKVFFSFSVAQMLPKDRTVAFAEVSISPFNGDVWRLARELEKHELFEKNTIETKINDWLGTTFIEEIREWRGNHFGVALIESPSKKVHTMYLIEVRDAKKAERFLENFKAKHPNEKLLKQKEGFITIYHYNLASNYKFAFINDFLIITDDTEILREMSLVDARRKDALSESHLFAESKQHFGKSPFAYAYIDAQKGLKSGMLQDMLRSAIPIRSAYYLPLLASYDGITFAASAGDKEVIIQSFLKVKKQLVDDGVYFHPEQKYRPAIAAKLPTENIIAAFGGSNLAKQVQKLQGTISGMSPGIGQDLSETLQGKARTLLPNISSVATLIKLLNNEYMVVASGSFADSAYALIIDRRNIALDDSVQKIIDDALMKIALDIRPQRKKITLADGTNAEELIRDPSKIEKKRDDYGSYFISHDGRIILAYGITNEHIIFSTNRKLLTNIVKNEQQEKDTKNTQKLFGRIKGNYDEVGYVDLRALLPVSKFIPTNMLPYLMLFGDVQMSKEIFDNGAVGYYTIGIE